MSRVNHKKIKISDGTTRNVISNANYSRKVEKKVGDKGDYAIVKFTSPFLSYTQEGYGTTSNPYIYKIDVQDNVVNSLAANKTETQQRLNESEDYNIFSQRVEYLFYYIYESMNNIVSFNIDLFKEYKISNISNIGNKNIRVSELHMESYQARKPLWVKSKNHFLNNMFFVEGFNIDKNPKNSKNKINLNINSTLILNNKDKVRRELVTAAGAPCDAKYHVHIIDASNDNFKFYITYNGLHVSFKYLKDKLKEKLTSAKIDFLVEYK